MLVAFGIFCAAMYLIRAGSFLRSTEDGAGYSVLVSFAIALFGIFAVMNHYVGWV